MRRVLHFCHPPPVHTPSLLSFYYSFSCIYSSRTVERIRIRKKNLGEKATREPLGNLGDVKTPSRIGPFFSHLFGVYPLNRVRCIEDERSLQTEHIFCILQLWGIRSKFSQSLFVVGKPLWKTHLRYSRGRFFIFFCFQVWVCTCVRSR